MKTSFAFRMFVLAASLSLGTAVVQAQDLNGVKARMEQRLGAVDSLKDQKVVGENNRGLLEPRANLQPRDQQVVSEENADRQAIYNALAAQTGTSADLVGRKRAEKIAAASRPGVWIQMPDGSWVQKQ